MNSFSENIRRIKKEISDLVKNEKYDQILDKLNLLEAPSFLDTNFQYKALFENSLSGIGIVTPNGNIIDCNPVLLKILGFSSLKKFQK